MPDLNVEGRHPSVKSIARWFDYSHLPEHLRGFSQQHYDLAANMVHDLPDSPELAAGLRKLLEAKDCFVRAAVEAHEQETARAEYVQGGPEGTVEGSA